MRPFKIFIQGRENNENVLIFFWSRKHNMIGTFSLLNK